MSNLSSGEEETISMHEAASILNMKPSELAEAYASQNGWANRHIRLVKVGDKLRLNKADVVRFSQTFKE